ncbi:MAG: MFS transporter [Elusimicrobia bacterium]|nr:MFS transporter [Elusimicrobiota bacterium]
MPTAPHIYETTLRTPASSLSSPTRGAHSESTPLNFTSAQPAFSHAPESSLSPTARKVKSAPPIVRPTSQFHKEIAEPSLAFPDDSSARGKTVLLVGTKSSRPFILEEAVRTAKALGLSLFLLDDPESRPHSSVLVPDSHFIPAPINQRDDPTVNAIVETVFQRTDGPKIDVVASFIPQYAKLTGRLTDRLKAAGIPGLAVAAADDKTETRRKLNAISEMTVPFRKVISAKDARRAYWELGGGKFVLKVIRGENSRFIVLNIDSEEAAEKAYRQLDKDIKAFVSRPEAKFTTFSQHPGIMLEKMQEKVPGSEEVSVETIMQNGQIAFAMVSDTKSIGHQQELAGGSLTFPSQQDDLAKQAYIKAAGQALKVLGFENGNARVDVMRTADGPHVLEINPFMGGAAIWKCIYSLTGMSLVEQGLRSLLGLRVDPGRPPKGVVDYRFMAAQHSGQFEIAKGLEEAGRLPGIEQVQMFVKQGDTIVAAEGNSYEEVGEIIGRGSSLREAMVATLTALHGIVLHIRLPDGAVGLQPGNYLQPEIEETQIPNSRSQASKTPGLFSKVVLGFFSTFILVSTVAESTSLAVSQMTQPLQRGFMALALLTGVSYAAYTLGSFLGGRWVDKFGIKRSYRTVLVFRTLVWTTIAILYNPATGTLPLAALVTLFSLDYFAHSIGRIAEHKLQVAWFHNSPTHSSRFGSFRDFIEYGTVFIASALGLLIALHGFGVVIYPAPLAFGVAALVSFFLALPATSLKEKVNWSAGFKTIFKNSSIAKPLAGYILITSFLYMMYYIIATAFGAYVAGSPQHAAKISGSLTGIYGVGALLGALTTDWIGRRIDKSTKNLPEAQRAESSRTLYTQSAIKSLKWAALGLVGTWFFISRTQIVSWAWPLFPISPALLLIGFTAQIASIHMDTIMKDRIPKQDKNLAGGILGAIRTLTYFSYVLGFLIWGGLFALWGPKTFFLFAAFYTGVAITYFWLARSLKNAK